MQPIKLLKSFIKQNTFDAATTNLHISRSRRRRRQTNPSLSATHPFFHATCIRVVMTTMSYSLPLPRKLEKGYYRYRRLWSMWRRARSLPTYELHSTYLTPLLLPLPRTRITIMIHANRPILQTIAISPICTRNGTVHCPLPGKTGFADPCEPFRIDRSPGQLTTQMALVRAICLPPFVCRRRRRKTGFVLLYLRVPCCTISGPNWFSPAYMSLVQCGGPSRRPKCKFTFPGHPTETQSTSGLLLHAVVVLAGKTGFSPADWPGWVEICWIHTLIGHHVCARVAGWGRGRESESGTKCRANGQWMDGCSPQQHQWQ